MFKSISTDIDRVALVYVVYKGSHFSKEKYMGPKTFQARFEA